MSDQRSETALKFSERDLAIILIGVGAEMAPEADDLVRQDVWEQVFNDGLAETMWPLHGDCYHRLTADGLTELARLSEKVAS